MKETEPGRSKIWWNIKTAFSWKKYRKSKRQASLLCCRLCGIRRRKVVGSWLFWMNNDVGSRPSQLVFISILLWYHAITIIATTDKCLRLWDCFDQGWPLGSFSRSSSTIVTSVIARMPPQGYFSHCHWSVRKVGGNYGYWLMAGGIKATMSSGCDTWMPDKQRINGTVLGVRHPIPAYSRSIEEVQRMWNGFTCSWICK